MLKLKFLLYKNEIIHIMIKINTIKGRNNASPPNAIEFPSTVRGLNPWIKLLTITPLIRDNWISINVEFIKYFTINTIEAPLMSSIIIKPISPVNSRRKSTI